MSFVDNWVRRYSINKWGVDPPVYVKQAVDAPRFVWDTTSKDIFKLMPKEFINPNNNSLYKVRPSIWDTKYKLTTVSEYRRFLNSWEPDVRDYQKDYSDCDDRAVWLWADLKKWFIGGANGLLITISPAHAKNVIITREGDIDVAWELEWMGKKITRGITSYVHQYFF